MKRSFLHTRWNAVGSQQSLPINPHMGKIWPALLGVGAAVVGLCTTIALAQAQDFYNKELFGNSVRIVSTQSGTSQLIVNGKVLLEKEVLLADADKTVDGVGVLIGYSGDGGNACDADVFVLSFPSTGIPRLDGPTGNCLEITYKIEGKAIRFTSGADGDKPKTWTWRPAKGMSAKVAAVISKPPLNSDLWADLRKGRVTHPFDLFKHPGMKDAIASLIGSDRKDVYDISSGPGSFSREGELFVGTACAPHQCDEREVMFVLDPTTKGIYVSWKPGDHKPLVVRPAAEQWSPPARVQLDAWIKRWETLETPPPAPSAPPLFPLKK